MNDLNILQNNLSKSLLCIDWLLSILIRPWLAKMCLGLAIGYLLLPFDLIPDFIPILGQLDDVVIIPLMLYIALIITPVSIIEHCRQQINNTD